MSVTVALLDRTTPMPHPGQKFADALREHLEPELDACCITLNVLRGYRNDHYAEHPAITPAEMKRINAFIDAAESHWKKRGTMDDWYMIMKYESNGSGQRIRFAESLKHLPSPGWDFFEKQLSSDFIHTDPIAAVSLASLSEKVSLYADEDGASPEQLAAARDFLSAAERRWNSEKQDPAEERLIWADLP